MLKIGITVIALLLAIAHIIWPGLNVDSITITLLLIAVVPWLATIFKSLEFPGGWKVEFHELKEQVQSIVAKDTEPLHDSPDFRAAARLALDDPTQDVVRALGNPKYTWRYLGGLSEETGRSKQEVLSALTWLIRNHLATESTTKGERIWALSPEGRHLLGSLLRIDKAAA